MHSQNKFALPLLCASLAMATFFIFAGQKASAQGNSTFDALQIKIQQLSTQISALKSVIDSGRAGAYAFWGVGTAGGGAATISNTDPKGYFDGADCNVFAGWACDADSYSQPTIVHFYADGLAGKGGIFIGATTANITREAAVGKLCGGYNNHGFSYVFPNTLKDGKQHTIYAYAINTPTGNNPLLGTNAKKITCVAPVLANSCPATACSANQVCAKGTCVSACTSSGSCSKEIDSSVADFVVAKQLDGIAQTFVAHPATIITNTNTAWISIKNNNGATIPWVWNTSDGNNTTAIKDKNESYTFERKFISFDTPVTKVAGTLTIAADNNYTVSLNGVAISGCTATDAFKQAHTCALPNLQSGQNVLDVTVTNTKNGNSANPAGLTYKLTLTGSLNTQTCSVDSDCISDGGSCHMCFNKTWFNSLSTDYKKINYVCEGIGNSICKCQSGTCAVASICGNGTCESGENSTTCSQDCCNAQVNEQITLLQAQLAALNAQLAQNSSGSTNEQLRQQISVLQSQLSSLKTNCKNTNLTCSQVCQTSGSGSYCNAWAVGTATPAPNAGCKSGETNFGWTSDCTAAGITGGGRACCCKTTPVCGNGTCEAGETTSNCATDCKPVCVSEGGTINLTTSQSSNCCDGLWPIQIAMSLYGNPQNVCVKQGKTPDDAECKTVGDVQGWYYKGTSTLLFKAVCPAKLTCDVKNNGCDWGTGNMTKDCSGEGGGTFVINHCDEKCQPVGTCVKDTCAGALPAGSKKIFVTSNSYYGNQLGSETVADALCQAAANNAGDGGTFKALVYIGNRAPNSILTGNTYKNYRKSGSVCNWNVIGTSNNLANSSLTNPIQYDEWGNLRSTRVWTDFKLNGSGGYTLLFNTSGGSVTATNSGKPCPSCNWRLGEGCMSIIHNGPCLELDTGGRDNSYNNFYDRKDTVYWYGNSAASDSKWAYSGAYDPNSGVSNCALNVVVATAAACANNESAALYCVEQ
jgi:hypothetical protein